jgi:hypothetical protein
MKVERTGEPVARFKRFLGCILADAEQTPAGTKRWR